MYDAATLLGSTSADSSGNWRFTVSPLSAGSHALSIKASDSAGNVSLSSDPLELLIDSAAPGIDSVRMPADGTYYNGDSLEFTVNFSEVVWVDTRGGSPRISLTVGSQIRYASYVSGSGTTALTFSYSVLSGDSDSNGITLGTLVANGATLQDLAGNDAALTLNGLGSTAAILIDGTLPTIVSVAGPTADGIYGAGSSIVITVDFSTAVDVDTSGGTPTLQLSSGGVATYAGGSGGTTLSFHYTVGSGENSADLDYSSTAALALNGATIRDAGGNHLAASLSLMVPGTAGSLGANKAIIIDTAAPTVTGATVTFSADSGISGTDRITNVAAQSVSGTLTGNLGVGERVQVSTDGGASWVNATASADQWALPEILQLMGNGSLQVRVIDQAGNIGAATRFDWQLDTVAPTSSLGEVRFANDSGISDHDLITRSASQTISAVLDAPLQAGERVEGSLDNGVTWLDLTSKISGSTLRWDNVTLAGSNTLQLRVSDTAGNLGATTRVAYVLDASAPSTTVANVRFSADSGRSDSDFVTNVATQTLSGTLSANLASDERVLVSLDDGMTWQLAVSRVGENTWTLGNVSLLASNILQVKVSDTAGNDGPSYQQAYVLDTTAPALATVDRLHTQSQMPVLTGTATLAAGETLTVTVGGATYQVTPGAGTWTLDLAHATPLSGSLQLAMNRQHSVLATVTDQAGNSSSDLTQGELIIGTPPVPPTTVITAAVLSADSGSSASDFITNVAQQTLSGTLSAALAAGERVELSLDGGLNWRTAASNANTWSSNVVLAGSGTLWLRVSGEGGSGALYRQDYVVDAAAPAAPAVASLTTASLRPVLTGTATLAEGERLSVSVGGAEYLVNSVDGRWRLDLGDAPPTRGALSLLDGGRYEVVATVIDLAGNRSSGSAQLTVALPPASPPPAAPATPLPPPGAILSGALPAAFGLVPGNDMAASFDRNPAARPMDGFQSFLPPLRGPGGMPLEGQWFGLEARALLDTLPSSSPLDSALEFAVDGSAAASGPALDETAQTPRSAQRSGQIIVRSGEAMALQLSGAAFVADPAQATDTSSTPSALKVRQANGTPLPDWLDVDLASGRLAGTPPAGFEGRLSIEVSGRDRQGKTVSQVFELIVTAPAVRTGQAADDARATVGRSSLAEQLRLTRNASLAPVTPLSALAT